MINLKKKFKDTLKDFGKISNWLKIIKNLKESLKDTIKWKSEVNFIKLKFFNFENYKKCDLTTTDF